MIISDNVRRAAAVEYERKARAPTKIAQQFGCRCQLQHKMNKRSLMRRIPFRNCFGGVLVNFDQKSWH
jgi:hypothetical protein